MGNKYAKIDIVIKNPELLAKYIHKIKNLEIIHKEELKNMNQMSEEERLDILIAYNEIIEYMNSMLEQNIFDA